jgi:hypothetical protein
MNTSELKKFDLLYPGHWIVDDDRDKAFKIASLLRIVEDKFVRAVAAYALFKSITAENIKQHIQQEQSKYEQCLNSIYAEVFVYSLDSITKLLKVLLDYYEPSTEVQSLITEYDNRFGNLKHIRDSAIHIEDRGRGVDKNEEKLPTSIIILGGFSERRFEFTAADGKQYEVEISESTLLVAHQIIQQIINSYTWEGYRFI